jgi:23S rRNA (adenine2503-C2)-methyltransferase
MILVDKIYSKFDKTIKYVFKFGDGLINELSYIDNDTGKDIICVGCQTACNMGCRFCFTTDVVDKVKCRNIEAEEISNGVKFIYKDLSLGKRLLLISYMGCGEPILNWESVLDSMRIINESIKNLRFAIATMLPKYCWLKFFNLIHDIKFWKLNVKIHLSLHFTNDELRKEWMPQALEIEPSIAALEFYKQLTGNSVEIHYALIDEINDYEADANILGRLLKNKNIPVKLLQYNARPCLEYSNSSEDRRKEFMHILERYTAVEYYIPGLTKL